ncbi:hypothetical protein GCM10020000_24530 [Streptomyces olivoverticillatus]
MRGPSGRAAAPGTPGAARAAGQPGAEVLALPPGRLLPPATERWIVDGLVTAMPDLRARELFAERRDMLTEADYVVAAVDRERDAVVALLTSRWAALPSGRSCLHVMTQFVGDAYRHGALFAASWAAHFRGLLADGHAFPEVIALKTYNPVVHCAMAAFAGHPDIRMYPDLTGGPTSRGRPAPPIRWRPRWRRPWSPGTRSTRCRGSSPASGGPATSTASGP